MNTVVHKDIDLTDHVAILAPTGTLDDTSAAHLRDRMLATAADEPHAVLVDITELELPGPTTMFADTAAEIRRWPGVPALVVDPHDRLPAHPTVAAAIAAIGEPPPRRLARRRLPNTRLGGRAGRAFVRDCCRRWHVEAPRAEDAVWVANELIENTIRHTPHEPSLRVELRGGELTVAVGDDDPRPPRPDPTLRPLHGLGAIDELAAAWGMAPRANGGKVVWAAL